MKTWREYYEEKVGASGDDCGQLKKTDVAILKKYKHTYTQTHTHTHIYIEREKEREGV